MYYMKGDSLFDSNTQIYINRSVEQTGRHLHAHDFIEIAYVVSGRGAHILDGRNYIVSAGDLFIIDSDVCHEFRAFTGGNAQLTVYNCVFTPGFIDETLSGCEDFLDITYHFMFNRFFEDEAVNRADIRLVGNNTREVQDLYEKMYREYTLRRPGYREMLKAHVTELLITIFRLYGKTKNQKEQLSIKRSGMVDKVIEYIRKNFSGQFSLEELSTVAFLSKSYLSSTFRKCTGMTVTEYVQKVRIEEACKMLETTDYNVIDVSMEVGYRDTKHFTEVFKRITGKTPGQYRKDRQGKIQMKS